MPPEQVIDGLRLAKAHAQNAHKQRRIGIIAIDFLFSYIEFALLIFVALGWSYGDWHDFDIYAPLTGGIFILIALIIIIVAIYRQVHHIGTERAPSQAQMWQRASKILLTALPALDDTVAPPVERSEAPDLDIYLPIQRRRINPPSTLQLYPATINYRQLILGAAFLLIFTNQLIQDPLREVFAGMNISIGQENVFLLPISLGTYMLAMVGLAFSSLIGGLLQRIYLDEQGVWWRCWSGWVHMSWTSVRAIGIYQRETAYTMTTTYVIDAEEHLISWSIHASSSARVCADSSQILQFAEARSGKPMRDIEPLVDALAREFPAKSDRSYFTEDDKLDETLNERVTALIHNTSFQSSAIVSNSRIILEALFSLALVCASLFGAYRVQNEVQPAYFASLPAKIHAKSPIFVDGLRQPDGLWQVRNPATDDPGSYAYTAAGYILSSTTPGSEEDAAMSRTYGAVAIEVTVSSSATISAGDQDGVGIIARNHSPEYDNNLLFIVGDNGYWAFGESGGFGASGHSATIHTGPEATNTLLVIARGNLYIGYINGHYVGQYFDQINDKGAAGHIGLVNLDSGITATFTDFTVWQINAPPALTIA